MKLPQGDGPSIRLCQQEPGDGQPGSYVDN